MERNTEKLNPSNCYLITSEMFSKEQLREDTMDVWNKFVKKNKDIVDDYFLTGINELIMHYKISYVKFNFNSEYFYTSSFLLSSFDPYLYVAPSLKKLKKVYSNVPIGYADWFLNTFPDVVLWAMTDEGLKEVYKILENFPEDEDLTGNYVSIKTLKLIIDKYIEQTGCILECFNYNLS